MEQTPHNQALLDWLRPVDEAEPLLDPDQRIVDPHHHLWGVDDPLALRVASRPGAKWQTRYLADDLLADITGSGHKVEKTVFLEADAFYQHDAEPPSRPVGETAEVQRIHDAVTGPTEIAAGVVGFVDLSLDTATVRRVLEAHIAACPNFKGIRFANAHDTASGATPHYSFEALAEESLFHDAALLDACILTAPQVRENIVRPSPLNPHHPGISCFCTPTTLMRR